MYTHEFADALRKFAALLKAGPDVRLSEITSLNKLLTPESSSNRLLRPSDMPIALNALLALSTIDKSDWAALVNDLDLPIEIRTRDASRDIMGKVLAHLERNPEARVRLEARVQSKDSRASPELARALSFLLKN